MQYTRLTSDSSLIDYLKGLERKIDAQATKGSGDIIITDPNTGVETIIGLLPDGTTGIQPFVGDTTPPPVATQPSARAVPGSLLVNWDGLFVGGEAKPQDFVHVTVIGHKIESGVTVQNLEVGVLRGSLDTLIITPDTAPIGTSWEFSFLSEDYNGNLSANSTRSILVTQLSLINDAVITDALADMNAATVAAQGAAEAAQGAADAAQDAADEVALAVTTKGKIYTQSVTPDADPNGLWIDTGHNNVPRHYLGVGKALAVHVVGGSSAGQRLTALGWDVTTVTAIPTLETASQYDLVAFDAGFGPLTNTYGTLASDLLDKGVSVFTSGNDTTTLAPLFTGAANRGTPKNTIRPVGTHPAATGWTEYSDGDLNLYLTGVKSDAVVTGSTLVSSLGTDQPVNVVWEHPTTFARWAHLETYASPNSVLNAHMNWLADNWIAIQDQSVVAAIAAAQLKADQAFNNAASAAEAAGTAQETADAKNRSWNQPTAPAGTGHAVGDLWYDTDDGYKPYRWDGDSWETVQDQAIQAVEDIANAKGRTYTQAVQPPVEARLPQNTWIDISLGTNYAVTKYWDPTAASGAGAWVAVSSKEAADAQTNAANDAKLKADAALASAINAQAYSNNPSFDDWTGTYPAGYSFWNSAPVKETTIIRKAPNAMRFNIADTAVQSGVVFNTLPHAANSEFYTVEVDLYLVSGSLGGSGVILDWNGLTPGRAQIEFATEIPGAVTGKWYRVSKTLRRPTTATGTFSSMGGYLMGQWSGHGTGAAKNIIFDWFNVRPSTVEEILAYKAPEDAQTKANTAQTTAITTAQQNTMLATAYSKNPSFDDWTATVPDLYTTFGAIAPTKDTTNKRVGVHGLKFTVPGTEDAGTDFTTPLAHMPNLEYVTVELEFMLLSGTLAGAGVLIDWQGMTAPNRGLVKLIDHVSAPALNKWYRISAVVKRPATAGTWTATKGWLMANWSELGTKSAKTIVYDWLNVRPATTEEVTAYTAPTTGYVDTAKTDAINAAVAADAKVNSSRTYINRGTSIAGITTISSPAPIVVDSPTAMGGKALQKTGVGNGWWADTNGKQAFDPSALYRMQARMRVVTAPTVNGGTFYMGVQGYLADGVTLCNSNGAASTSSQHYLKVTTFPTGGAWTDYVAYFKGNAAGTASGSGTIFDPYKLQANVRHFEPMVIMDYSAGNGVIELSQISVEVVDAQAAVDLAAADTNAKLLGKNRTYYQTAKPSMTGNVFGDVWYDTDDLNKPYVWNNADWVSAQDGSIALAQSAADAKIETWYNATAPTGLTAANTGDLWIDSDNGQISRWTGSAWVLVNDNGVAAVATKFSDLGIDQTWVNDIETQADKSITTFFGTATPTGMGTGDLWLSGEAGIPMKRWDGDSWETFEDPNVQNAFQRAGEAEALADSKIKTYAATTAPTGLLATDAGDLWINTTTGSGAISRWSGTEWQLVTDNGQAAANTALANLGINQTWVDTIETQADRAISTYYGTGTPTGMETGDLWLSGVPGTPMKRWDGDSWENFEDPNVAAAYGKAGEALDLADTKIKTYAQTTAPTGLLATDAGDLWIDTSTGTTKGQIKRWDGDSWELVTDNGAAAAAKKNTTWYQPAQPPLTGNTTGDVWFDTDDQNKIYVWNGAWTSARDAGIDIAIGAANGKNTNYYQPGMPTGGTYKVGDLWVDTDDGNKLYSYNGSTFVSAQDSGISAAQASANGKNKIHYSTDPATGTVDTTDNNRPFVEGDTWFQKNGTGIVIGQWEFVSGAWASRKVDGVVLANIDAATITVNKLKGTQMEANTIDATKLTISDFTNLLDDAEIVGPGWTKGSTPASSSILLDTNEKTNVWRFNAASAQVDVVNNNMIPVNSAKDRFWLSVRTYSTLNAAGYLRVQFCNESGVQISYSDITIPAAASAWTERSMDIGSTAVPYPAGTKYLKVQPIIGSNATSGYILYGSMALRRKNGGELIVDGAIDGKTIIGALIQTDNTPIDTAASRGIKLTSTELMGYDSTGTKNFSLTTGGTLTLRGTLKSGSTIEAVTVTGAGVQTNIGATTGVKVTDTGIKAYSGGALSFHLDATTGLLEVPGLKANSVTSTLLAADAVTARAIAIGDFSNVAYGGEFNDTTDLANWALGTGITYTTSAPYAGAGCVQSAAGTGTRIMTLNTVIAVQPGDKFTMEFWKKMSADWNGGGTSQLRISNQSGSVLHTVTMGPGTTSWTQVPSSYTVPASGVTGLIIEVWFDHTIGTAWVDNLVIRKQVGATLIEDGSITTGKIITSGLDASAISAFTITSNQIKAKGIQVDRLVISSTDNLIIESDFSNGGANWELGANKSINPTSGRGGLPALRVTGTTSSVTALNLVNKFVVEPDRRFRGSISVKSDSPIPIAGVAIYLRCYTTATAYTTLQAMRNTTPLSSNSWHIVSGISPELPDGTIAVEPYLRIWPDSATSIVDIDQVSLTRAYDGALIVDGAISGQTVIGATIKTDTNAGTPGVGGIVLDKFKFAGYSPLGTETFKIDAITGQVTSVGTFDTLNTQKTETTGESLALSAKLGTLSYDTYDEFDGVPGLQFNRIHSVQGAGLPASLYFDGRYITLTTDDMNTSAWVANKASSELKVGEGTLILSSYTYGATEDYDYPRPVIRMNSGEEGYHGGEGLEMYTSYRTSDLWSGSYGIAGFQASRERARYSGGNGMHATAMMYHADVGIADTRMEVGYGGQWGIEGVSNNVLNTGLFGNYGGVTGELVIGATSKVRIGDLTNDRLVVTPAGVTVTGSLTYPRRLKSAMGFNNGWTNFSTSYQSAYIVEIAPDVMTLVAMIKGGTLTDGIQVGNVSTGYRPADTVNLPCVIRTATPSNVAGIVQIQTTGAINVFGVTASTSYVMISVTYFKSSSTS